MATEAQLVVVARNVKKLAVIFDNPLTINELVIKIKAAMASGVLTDDDIEVLAQAIWSNPYDGGDIGLIGSQNLPWPSW